MKLCRIFLPILSALTPIACATASAQAPEPRLHGPIRESTRAVLPGSVPPRVLGAHDLGPVSATQPLHGITLVFRRSDAQEADLQQLLAAQQDPASPQFHHWLTPEAFGQRFGMADSDLEATKQWLGAHGFEVTGVSRAHDRITFSGTARQVSDAFATNLHHFQVDGEPHIAPNSDLSLPSDLAAITTTILHLSDFRPHPTARLATHPAYTTGNTQTHFLTPPDLAVMYDLPPNTYPYPGSGQSIAVVGQSYVDLSIDSIVREFLTSTTTRTFTPVLVPGSGVQAVSPGDQGESEIDLEYTSALLNGANIVLVYVGSNPNYGVFDALAFAIDQNIAPVVSISYSECETFLSSAELAQGTALFQQAGLQGQTLVAASGDAGSTACAFSTASSLSTTQLQALAVGYPADSPYVTAVGGTQMAPGTFTQGSSTFWRAATSPFDSVPSLLSYVPEIAWNEDSPSLGIFAGGGGASAIVARPSWQTGVPGIPAGSTRLLPDIALQASSSNPGFLFCTDDRSYFTAGQNPGCNLGSESLDVYPHAGGTSFAAPTFAAMVALLNQNTQTLGQGNLNPILYGLAADPSTAASVFHDITSGSIACTPGVPGCSAAGQSGFSTTPGYDLATGLGSLDFLHLLAAWPASHPTRDATVVALYPYNTAVNPGDTDVVNLFVTSVYQPAPMTPPSGSVSVAVDGATVASNLPFASFETVGDSANASFTFTAPPAPGTHVIVVTYPGDSTHGPSTATTSILVGNVLASGSITLASANLNLPANGSASTTITVTPSGGYDGRLFWSLSLTSNSTSSLSGCYFIPSLLVEGVSSTTTLTLGAGIACSSAVPAARFASRPLAARAAAHMSQTAPWSSVPIATCLLVCCLLPASRQRRLLPLLCMSLIASGLVLSGCGGSGAGAATPSPVISTANTYTATLTGRDSVNGAITSSTNFTVTVQ